MGLQAYQTLCTENYEPETSKTLKTAWIGDSRASHHMKNDETFLFNKKIFTETVQMGYGTEKNGLEMFMVRSPT